MTRKEQLLALADRVEALDGPCREVDAFISAWTEVHHPNLFDVEQSRVDEREYLVKVSDPAGDSVDVIRPPHYTTSIDAAMTLFGENPPRLHINIADDQITSVIAGGRQSVAATPALALTAAALRAQAEIEQ